MEVELNFSELKQFLIEKLDQELPGALAHQKLMSYNRPLVNEVKQKNTYRESSVLLLFYPIKQVPHLVFILRQTYEGIHSAQIGFPGGKKESIDESLKETALREAQEELQIQPSQVEILGKLSEIFIPPSNFILTPYVGIANKRPNFVKDEYEVAEIIEVNYRDLMDINNFGETRVSFPDGTKANVPCFTFNNRIVWGATAMVTQEIIEILSEQSS